MCELRLEWLRGIGDGGKHESVDERVPVVGACGGRAVLTKTLQSGGGRPWRGSEV